MTQANYQELADSFPVGATRILTFPLWKADGTAYLEADITEAKLTLRDRRTGTVINGRDAQDVNDANGGSLIDGALILELGPDDNVLAWPDEVSQEVHIAYLEWKADPGGVQEKAKIPFVVVDLGRVP